MPTVRFSDKELRYVMEGLVCLVEEYKSRPYIIGQNDWEVIEGTMDVKRFIERLRKAYFQPKQRVS